ncbi:hotdog family protein [Uliginosibacterium sp. H1]|uniref:hotdog family protein n=1 Tax=Uliginosibacterium sp. H1 TaxID=3114757 RepID=UPI002E197D11|nr:hotdog family protein [Uliginosibacterium sp. H1]
MTEATSGQPVLPDIASLLPHASRMLLLDRCVEIGEEHLVAEVVIRPDTMFCRDGAVGAWVGIEYMAQAVGAYGGNVWRQQGQPPKVGFLLGTRKQLCHRPRFAIGSVLRVTARREFQGGDGLAAFACSIEDQDGLAAEATLSVFEPANVAQYLQQAPQ